MFGLNANNLGARLSMANIRFHNEFVHMQLYPVLSHGMDIMKVAVTAPG